MDITKNFYDDLSSRYHLIFEDWDADIKNQGKTISSLLPSTDICGPLLDCSCGIGTQLIGLKLLGYDIEGSDISKSEVERVIQETKKRNLVVNVRIDDMRDLNTAPLGHYRVIMTMGNSLPHLFSDQEIIAAFASMKERLRLDGIVLIGVKDYAPMINERTTVTKPLFINDKYGKRIIHQVWDWKDERVHDVHLYITQRQPKNWLIDHSVVTYRAITLEEIKSLMIIAGFVDVSILFPEKTGFYQPIIRGYKHKV
jgi:2-polyprenyl-3-methyl-5-hydroxy-6-metoxy-1,4-benzoquinol methylase